MGGQGVVDGGLQQQVTIQGVDHDVDARDMRLPKEDPALLIGVGDGRFQIRVLLNHRPHHISLTNVPLVIHQAPSV
jgi:hypothetical protein